MDEHNKAIFEMENYTWQSWEHGYPIRMTDKSTDVIIKALQKQIPMKPIGWNSECWKCGKHLGGMEDRPTYCPYCGQKLDWED